MSLLAMGLSHAAAECCIRISLSVETTRTEVESFMELMTEALQPIATATENT